MEEVKHLIDAQKPVVLHDVRNPEELQSLLGHLPSVMNIAVEELPRRLRAYRRANSDTKRDS